MVFAAAQLLRFGRVRRIYGALFVDDAVVAVARSDDLHQPFVDGAQRIHAYKEKQRGLHSNIKHLRPCCLLFGQLNMCKINTQIQFILI